MKKQTRKRKNRSMTPVRPGYHKFPCRLQTEHPIARGIMALRGQTFHLRQFKQIVCYRKKALIWFISVCERSAGSKVIRDTVLITQLMTIILLCAGAISY
jgi:hypothetical protein